MIGKTRTVILAMVCVLVICSAPAYAQKKSKSPASKQQSQKTDPSTQNALDAKDNLIEKTKEYKEAVQKYLTFLEKDVKTKSENVDRLKTLLDQGLIARRELDRAQSDLVKAQLLVTEQQKELASADNMIEEVEASKQLLLLPPPKVGTYQTTTAMIRYNGASGWDLSMSGDLSNFFTQKFGRPLPISAYGQTATHEKMGFDHTNRMDVAVNPDSPEGQAVMDYLRAKGIPFIAFRHAVAGSATGAHIHVGPPSHRIQ